MDLIDRFRNRPWVSKVFVTFFVLVPLGSTLYALGAFSWYRGSITDIVLFFAFYVLTTLGVTIGYHRLLTHRSFDCHPAVKVILLALGCMSVQGNPIRWTATHIKHHAHADKDDDPHSPADGLFHAHIGWLANPNSFPDPKIYAPRLLQDPIAVFFERTYSFWLVLAFLAPFLLGGWSGLLWGGLVRAFFTHHVTWSVNSICHLFGRRPFKTPDQSSNNWIVSILGFGEGWHNNHHAFPQSAFHGLRRWQIDASGYIIWLLGRLRLAWNIHAPSPVVIAEKTLPS